MLRVIQELLEFHGYPPFDDLAQQWQIRDWSEVGQISQIRVRLCEKRVDDSLLSYC